MRGRTVAGLGGLFLLAFGSLYFSQRHIAESDLLDAGNDRGVLNEHRLRGTAAHGNARSSTASGAAAPQWRGLACFKGTELSNRKLVKECRESLADAVPRAHPPSCEAVVAWDDGRRRLGGSNTAPAPCGYYATGRFEPPFAKDVLAASPPRRSTVCRDGIASDIFRGAVPADVLHRMMFTALDPSTQLRELALDGCAAGNAPPFFSYFSREELVLILHRASRGVNGQGLLFSGDSIMRQLMLRIVAYIRGERFFSEHYFHQDGLYVLRRDRDELVVLDQEGIVSHGDIVRRFFPGYLPASAKPDERPDDGDVLLVMMFMWEQQPTTFRKEFLQMPNVPLHVAAFMYWWDNKGQLEDIDPYMRAVEAKHAREDAAGDGAIPHGKKTTYLYITTPWTSPKLFGGVDAEKRLARNDKAVRWVRTSLLPPHNDAGAGQQQRAYGIVDFASIAEVEHLNKTMDGIHYACIWLPKYPQLARRQKYNHDQCRDPMSLAVVQWMAHAVLHAL